MTHFFFRTFLTHTWPAVMSCSNNGSYLTNEASWTTCDYPQNIVMWHVVLFSILLATGALQIFLCAIQVINGCLGCLCGDCRESKDVRSKQPSNCNHTEPFLKLGTLVALTWSRPADWVFEKDAEFMMKCCFDCVFWSCRCRTESLFSWSRSFAFWRVLEITVFKKKKWKNDNIEYKM